MADLKISQLTSASTPLAGTEVLPIVQSSSTKKIAVDDLTVKNIRSNATTGILQVAGPAAAATRVMTVPDANFTAARVDAAQSFTGDQTLGTGNLIQGTAAKGFNFTANTPTAGMTSQLLNWYEQGTFTAVVADANTGGNTSTTATSFYTRIGNIVTCEISLLNISTVGLTAANTLHVRGLPFNSASSVQTSFPVIVGSITFSGYVMGSLGNSRTFITFVSCSSGSAVSALLVSALTSGSARLTMGFSYRV